MRLVANVAACTGILAPAYTDTVKGAIQRLSNSIRAYTHVLPPWPRGPFWRRGGCPAYQVLRFGALPVKDLCRRWLSFFISGERAGDLIKGAFRHLLVSTQQDLPTYSPTWHSPLPSLLGLSPVE